MASTYYTTKQGETWDEISLEVYGSEAYADVLMQSNYDLLDILIFSAGTVVYTPEIVRDQSGDAPPWVADDSDITESVDPYL